MNKMFTILLLVVSFSIKAQNAQKAKALLDEVYNKVVIQVSPVDKWVSASSGL